jgi:NAD(P)-dependent dehydrogenase (short-subunit alcohol dehydrogenase family)
MSSKTRPQRVALITGGTTGIGFATARLLHEQGYAVVTTGRDLERLAAAKAALPSDVIILPADAGSLADAERVAQELRQRHGKLDFVFFNAGTGPMVPLEAIDEAHYESVFTTNVKGPLFLLQKLLPLFTQDSSVVFNSALGVHLGLPSYAVNTASKGALLGLVTALSTELAPRGIRVNAIVPGPIETPAWGKLGLPPEALGKMMEAIAARVPLGRAGTPEEAAGVVAFLASPAASFLTGASIHIDGGLGTSFARFAAPAA